MHIPDFLKPSKQKKAPAKKTVKKSVKKKKTVKKTVKVTKKKQLKSVPKNSSPNSNNISDFLEPDEPFIESNPFESESNYSEVVQ